MTTKLPTHYHVVRLVQHKMRGEGWGPERTVWTPIPGSQGRALTCWNCLYIKPELTMHVKASINPYTSATYIILVILHRLYTRYTMASGGSLFTITTIYVYTSHLGSGGLGCPALADGQVPCHPIFLPFNHTHRLLSRGCTIYYPVVNPAATAVVWIGLSPVVNPGATARPWPLAVTVGWGYLLCGWPGLHGLTML